MTLYLSDPSHRFIYGGNPDPYFTGNLTAQQITEYTSYDEVYVLSLPAFVWFKADYPPQHPRFRHTCEVVGNRQILSIGGHPFTDNNLGHYTADNFAQGLGIFDMTAMQWSDGYDANAQPYQTPDVVKAWYRENGSSPENWNSPVVQGFFEKASTTNPGSSAGTVSESPSNSTAATSYSSTSHTGAIAGGVVGGVAAIALIAGLVFWLLRRKRRQNGSQLGYAAPEQQKRTELQNTEKRNPQELPEDYRPLEMDASHPTMELDGKGQSYLRNMKSVPSP